MLAMDCQCSAHNNLGDGTRTSACHAPNDCGHSSHGCGAVWAYDCDGLCGDF